MDISITKLPNARFLSVKYSSIEIITTVTQNPDVVREWIQVTMNIFYNSGSVANGRLVVGVAVQLSPGLGSPAATLQLCVGFRCLIFQLERADTVPDNLREFLTHQGITLVGLWNGGEAMKLMVSKHQLAVRDLVDLRFYVTEPGGAVALKNGNAPFEEIVRVIMGLEGVRLEYSIHFSDWGAELLHHDQILHACGRVYFPCLLGTLCEAWKIPRNQRHT